MAKVVVRFWDKIIVVLLGVVGVFTSCKEPEMYGTPHAVYELKGVVTDKETSKPIPNIQIVNQMYRGDTAYTDTEGKYAFAYGGLFDHFHLIIEDIDGDENGGYFESQEIDIPITQADQVEKGKENWDWGKYVKTQNIKLEKKQ